MSQTKFEIFKIQISENSKFDFDKKTQDLINDFLSAENNVYINHSTSVLSEDIEEYGTNKTVNKYLVVSLIYKDLNASEFNLRNTSMKVKEVVKKEIEEGENLPDPKIETDFDKEIRQLTKAIINSGDSDKEEVSYPKKSTENKTK